MQEQKNRIEAELAQFSTVRGHAMSSGWKFTLTAPVRYLGITPEDVSGSDGDRAVVIFDEPGGNQINGVVKVGSDLPAGRTAKNARSITLADRSFTVQLGEDLLHDIGVECDLEEGIPPIVDVWAGDGVLSIRKPETKKIAKREGPDIGLHSLPEQVRRDFEAVEIEGYSVEEWAEERDLARPETSENLPEHYIRGNIERAKTELGEETIAALKAGEDLQGNEVTTEIRPVGNAQLRAADGGIRVAVTQAVREALPDDELGMDTSIIYDQLGGIVNGQLFTYEDESEAPTGYGNDRVRKVSVNETNPDIDTETWRYGVKTPDPSLEHLGYNPDEADGEYINLYASDGSIAFERPATDTVAFKAPEPTPIDQPIILEDETARQHLQEHGSVVVFRTILRSTGDAFWRTSRTGEKMGDCTIEQATEIIDPEKTANLMDHCEDSGHDSVDDWQEAIRGQYSESQYGYLYRVSLPNSTAETDEDGDKHATLDDY